MTINAFISGALDPMPRHKIGRKWAQGNLPDVESLMKIVNVFATGKETACIDRQHKQPVGPAYTHASGGALRESTTMATS